MPTLPQVQDGATMIPTLDDLRMEYALYCATLPADRTPEDFTAYVYHALAEQIKGLQYCFDLMVEQNKALQDDQWRKSLAKWMKEKVKA